MLNNGSKILANKVISKEAVEERDGEDVRLAFDQEGNALFPVPDVPEAQQNPGAEVTASTDSPERFEIVRLWGGNAPFGIWDNEAAAFCRQDDSTLQFVDRSNAENFVKNIQPIGKQLILPEPSAVWTADPVRLYRQALLMLDRAVESSYLGNYLRDQDLDYSDAQDTLNAELPQLMVNAMTFYPEIEAAYQFLPMFREWLVEDILERYYQDVPDGLDAPARHANDPDAPEWLKEALSVPAVEHSELEQDRANTPAPPAPEAVPEFTGAGVPEQPKSDDTIPVEPDFAPNAEKYWDLKAQHPDKLIGVQVGEFMMFYGKDAEEAASVLETKAPVLDIPGLGQTPTTGSRAAWQSTLKKLLEHGHSVVLARPDPERGPDAPYEIIKERDAAEYIPIGMDLTVDGRHMKIESVNFTDNEVMLRDMDLQGWFPIFRSEPSIVWEVKTSENAIVTFEADVDVSTLEDFTTFYVFACPINDRYASDSTVLLGRKTDSILLYRTENT